MKQKLTTDQKLANLDRLFGADCVSEIIELIDEMKWDGVSSEEARKIANDSRLAARKIGDENTVEAMDAAIVIFNEVWDEI